MLLPLLAMFYLTSACKRELPLVIDQSSPEYAECASAFYVGVAALEIGDFARAEQRLKRVTELAPQEPAGWANLGLLSLRQKDFDLGFERLEKARALAPEQSVLYVLLGCLESERSRTSQAISHLSRAVELDPENIRTIYSLAREFERRGDEPGEGQAQKLLNTILESQAGNLAALVELARLAAKRGDSETLGSVLDRISKRADGFPPEAQQQLDVLKKAAAGPNARDAALQATLLAHLLAPVAAYQQGLDQLQLPVGEICEPIASLIKLPSPSPTPAPADDALSFAPQLVSNIEAANWGWVGLVHSGGGENPILAMANGRELRFANGSSFNFPGGSLASPPSREGILGLDFNYDFKTDIALVGAGGLRLYRQDSSSSFSDMTAATGLPALVTSASYAGVWAADLESDGDLDVILGAETGPPNVLGNNGDGTLRTLKLFDEVSSLRSFMWADLDGDGDADASMIDARGQLFVFDNERLSQFKPRAVPATLVKVLCGGVADANNDGILDLILLQSDGVVLRLSHKDGAGNWDVEEIAQWPTVVEESEGATVSLFAADLDNNGGIDLVASGIRDGRVWLSDEEGRFHPLATSVPLGRIFFIADLSDDGRLDLAGLSQSGQPIRFLNRSQRDYQWKEVRARAAQASGDRRINPFGIGGAIEIRSGLLVQKQLITGPAVHFGLGKSRDVDLVRIFWPNGFVQAEFDVKSDLPGTAPTVFDQRLEGSCPFVFAFDGEQMSFVTDFIWRSPLGLRINAQETAGVMQTEDWVKIRADMLKAKDGFYDVRITADLWETHFFDHVSLMVVDHPVGTDVFVDERFASTPPELMVHATSPPRAVERAWDDLGNDVTHEIKARDARYLDTFGRGPFQGVTRDHWVEVEIGEEAPESGALWLVAHGWIHPTDTSINIAISQGSHPPPQGLSLEVPDGKGGWEVARSGLGFPSGKNKTILITLEGVFRPGTPRRLRLRTNLEVYWDSIEWAQGLSATTIRGERLLAHTAELRYRGFSTIRANNISSPELPEYLPLAGTAQRWRDLVGYYTRFGDVKDLLSKVDDRYVIMNAGDEIRFLFEAPSDPPDGWLRDFVLIGDGWVKDGNFNTTFSQTVLPLPSHNQPNYTKAPGRLQDDPVYRRHAEDWREYHTRYVTPSGLQKTFRLRNKD
ncbi:MAG TPA: FG-GAP-like repeat-containing protein [Blastocatellia bacterium]|nr:FG-GAP-like repeat-containing protein [Blastocatellia bacterium]